MSIFKKLFQKNSDSDSKKSIQEERSRYMPDVKLPLDERFTHNFTAQGGRFLYCINEQEVHKSFDDILIEHDYYEKDVFCTDTRLRDRFNGFNLNYNSKKDSNSFFFTTCEYIIADNGAILFSSNQLGECKPAELPDTIVVLATTSQIVESIGEGLRGIKHRCGTNIPTNITTLKHFKEPDAQQKKDLMNYGVINKRVYLLLLEDL